MNANIVMVGHVDHGKSTLIGRLLYDSESIQGKKIEEIKKVAQEYKKRFEFAHLLDSLEEEVKEDKTIDTTQVFFKGKNFYTIIDAPGHKEFLKNMLTGASYAHAAVVVVSAPEGIQEQTRRHLFLLKFLGLKQLFVCVNKLDTLAYNAKKFETLREGLDRLLTLLQYKVDTVFFIPISALKGDNVYKKSEKMPWYTGPTLIQALDDNIVVTEEVSILPRFVVQDTYEVDGEHVVVGRVEAGIFHEGDELMCAPSGVKAELRQVKVFGADTVEAKHGDSVGFVLLPQKAIKRGEVCGLTDSEPTATTHVSGEMFLLSDHIEQGESLFIKCATSKVPCTIKKINLKIDSETGEQLKDDLTSLKANEAALVEIETHAPLVIEKYTDIPSLGRFILEKNNKNIAAGIIP